MFLSFWRSIIVKQGEVLFLNTMDRNGKKTMVHETLKRFVYVLCPQYLKMLFYFRFLLEHYANKKWSSHDSYQPTFTNASFLR